MVYFSLRFYTEVLALFNSLNIHPINFISAMSNALELSTTGISKHHLRTAIISKHIGDFFNLKYEELEILIYSALLHDIGAASNWDEKHYIAHSDYKYVFNHAENGYQILKDSQQLEVLATPIRYHHDRYKGGNPSGLKGQDIPLISRIIHISDRIEVGINKNKHILQQRNRIIDGIESLNFFDPEIVQAVKELGKIEYFWLDIVNPIYESRFLSDLKFFGKLLFDIDDLITMAEIFSKVVDATSHYTAEHSKNVARVTRYLAQNIGFSSDEAKKLYLAGLLHDLGKLAVPNEILNKDGPYTTDEYDIIKQHPYYGHRILEQVEGFENIAFWVGTHHETLDGQGYPYKLSGENIELGSRILAVADVFSSLIEDRPYRKGMDLDEAIKLMEDMANNFKIDKSIVRAVKMNSHDIYSIITKY